MLETIICGVLLAALLSISGPTVHLIQLQIRAADQKSIAMNELVNVTDRIVASKRFWSESELNELELSSSCLDQLAEPRIQFESEFQDLSGQSVSRDEAVAQRIQIALQWQPERGDQRFGLNLNCWVFPAGGMP